MCFQSREQDSGSMARTHSQAYPQSHNIVAIPTPHIESLSDSKGECQGQVKTKTAMHPPLSPLSPSAQFFSGGTHFFIMSLKEVRSRVLCLCVVPNMAPSTFLSSGERGSNNTVGSIKGVGGTQGYIETMGYRRQQNHHAATT